MWRCPGLIAVVLFLAGCGTSVLEMRAPAPGTELWGHRTLVVAHLPQANDYRRDAEEAFAYWLRGAVSGDAMERGEAAFDEELEEDRTTWDTVVGVRLDGFERFRHDPFDSKVRLDSRDGYFYKYADFRVSVVRRADGREVLSMIIRSRAGGAGTDSFEQLLDYAAKRAGEELSRTGLFR